MLLEMTLPRLTLISLPGGKVRSASFSFLILQHSYFDSRRALPSSSSWLADTNDSGILLLLARLLRASECVLNFLRSALIGRVNYSKVESPSRYGCVRLI